MKALMLCQPSTIANTVFNRSAAHFGMFIFTLSLGPRQGRFTMHLNSLSLSDAIGSDKKLKPCYIFKFYAINQIKHTLMS